MLPLPVNYCYCHEEGRLSFGIATAIGPIAFFFIVVMGWDCVSLEPWLLTGPLISQVKHKLIWDNGRMILSGEDWRTWRNLPTYPSASLSTTNPTWSVLGANQGLHREKSGIRHLWCHGPSKFLFSSSFLVSSMGSSKEVKTKHSINTRHERDLHVPSANCTRY
jgi:hypothetical protein